MHPWMKQTQCTPAWNSPNAPPHERDPIHPCMKQIQYTHCMKQMQCTPARNRCNASLHEIDTMHPCMKQTQCTLHEIMLIINYRTHMHANIICFLLLIFCSVLFVVEMGTHFTLQHTLTRTSQSSCFDLLCPELQVGAIATGYFLDLICKK